MAGGELTFKNKDPAVGEQNTHRTRIDAEISPRLAAFGGIFRMTREEYIRRPEDTLARL